MNIHKIPYSQKNPKFSHVFVSSSSSASLQNLPYVWRDSDTQLCIVSVHQKKNVKKHKKNDQKFFFVYALYIKELWKKVFLVVVFWYPNETNDNTYYSFKLNGNMFLICFTVQRNKKNILSLWLIGRNFQLSNFLYYLFSLFIKLAVSVGILIYLICMQLSCEFSRTFLSTKLEWLGLGERLMKMDSDSF